MAVEAALIVGAVITLVGAGVSAYGQHQAGKTQAAIANFNARQQDQQAAIQLRSMEAQAALQKRDAETNFKLRAAEAKARMSNADALDATALAQDTLNRVNLSKRREEFAQMQGSQRAAIAASGVVESVGTPLDLLAETAEKIQLDSEEQAYIGEVQRRTLFNEAEQERLGGRLALAGATLDRDSGVAAAGLRDAAARGEYLGNLRGAEISRLTGKAAQQAANYGAAATIFSATGSALGTAGQFRTS